MSEDDTTIPDGIGDDVRLIIDTAAGRVLDTTLIMAALSARMGNGEITPFLYRVPLDPEEPNAPRPLRRAVLAIVDDEILVNNVGVTDVEWNDWISRSAEWEAANPVPRHKPSESCDCQGLPLPPGTKISGHCAAVGGIVPWQPKVRP